MNTSRALPAPAVWNRLAPRKEGSAGLNEQTLNVTVLYEDEPTRQWAAEVCERVAGVVGSEALRTIWWRLEDLSEPAVLAGAVSTTLRADVIIIAIRAAEGFPLPFYVWVDSWLPYHPQGGAALVALITLPDPPTVQLDRARVYLRAVARQGRLDFLLEERRLPAETILEAQSAAPAQAVLPPAPQQPPAPRRTPRRLSAAERASAIPA
ncbi:MAG: hypothetical protein ACREIC_03870 [Limisphaerales bacterium]